ncbi:MAG: hypothetical protein ACRDZ3_01810, partial [Acidimicrobiia bacterium]
EEEYELWDGEIVVKGQPSLWHEALRAGLLAQLHRQLPVHLTIAVSSVVGDETTSPRSDGSVLDASADPPATLVWIEVVSPADLRRRDDRRVGERRRRFLFDHGVHQLWALTDSFGAVTLTVLAPDAAAQAFASPAKVALPVRDATTEHVVTIDLEALEDAGSRAGSA